MENIYVLIATGIGAIFLLWLLLYFVPVGLWFTALVSNVRISLLQLVLMRWRKVPPRIIVNSLIASTKAGLNLARDDMEAHYLAGGNVQLVINALISAEKANIKLDFKTTSKILNEIVKDDKRISKIAKQISILK